MPAGPPRPRLHLHNHHPERRLPLRWLKQVAQAAIPRCQKAARSAEAPLLHLEEVEVSLVSDDDIARVHGEFLDDPTPTDVITFHHGEILVSTDTAARQGPDHGQDIRHETALYIVHGLMHLGGWDDHEPAEAAQMARLQEQILKECLS
jgi:probable rRNA maturation factor